MIRHFLKRNDEIAILCRDSGWVIPLIVACAPVVQIDSFPERIVARVLEM